MNVNIHNILCPTDFSASATYALQYAIEIADRHGAAVELFHVAEVSAYSQDEVEDGERTYEDTLRDRLREIADSVDTNVAIETNLVAGVPYIEIVNRANALPAAFIVIGTHGRTGIKHLLIGSVAEKVVRTASCPVLTVRHPDHALDF